MKIKLDKNLPLTAELVSKLLQVQSSDTARKEKLANYYVGEQAILRRTTNDPSKPNNKEAHPYGNFITDSITGYFMGQPVKYTAVDEANEDFAAQIREIFNYNDEHSNNVELTKDTCKYGVAYELMWLDEAADIRFKRVDAVEGFPVYDNTLEEEIIYFIRHFKNNILDNTSEAVEVYIANEIVYYQKHNEQLNYMGSVPHNWGMVPVSIYYNNIEELGDYELVMTLIDAYDKLTSDSLNDFEAFVDAYLLMKGMDGTEPDDVAAMKENRILLLPQDGDASWLTKNINDTYFQNVLNTLNEDIHKFSKVPDMMSEGFGTNLAGIAIKYKLMGLEQKVAVKESYFKRGLQRRIELITNILDIMGTSYDFRNINIDFTRNLPVNELEEVQIANQLIGLVSDETVLNRLSFVQDAAKEIEKRDSLLDTDVPSIGDDNGTIEA